MASLSEERTLQVTKNKVLTETTGLKRYKWSREWIKL